MKDALYQAFLQAIRQVGMDEFKKTSIFCRNNP